MLVPVLACPDCESPLKFAGEISRSRLSSGVLTCSNGHRFQVKDELAILKDPKLSSDEFEWEVAFPDIERYNEIRRQYRSHLSAKQDRADELLLEELVRKTARSGAILDVASGMGTLLLALAKRRAGVQILGTDVGETPLRGAMLKLREQHLYGKVSLCVLDGKHLALKPSRIECVASHFGFNNIPQTGRALSEAWRVLTSDGVLVFSALWLKDGSKSHRLATRMGYGQVATESSLSDALSGAGFQIESVETFYSGEWPHNPMDRLPVEGDWFAHALIRARKSNRS